MLIFLLSLCFSQTIISEVVGQAVNQVITSREVEADVIFTALYQKVDKPNYTLPLKGRALQSAASNVLMEVLIIEEAESFKLASINSAEINRAVQTFQANLAKSNLQSRWKSLGVSQKELSGITYRKLRAVKFLEMKKSTFLITPTEEELNLFFAKRKSHFTNQTIAEARAEIEKELRQEKLDQAIREWFQVLRSKYEVRNLLIES